MSVLTILLLDDHQLVRRGLRALLEAEADFTVVGEASDGRAGMELVERLLPDILLVDVMMPGLNGLEVTRQVTRRYPQTRVVVLSMYANEAYVFQALRNGASGYVLKDSSAEVLMDAVRSVASGRRYLCPSLSERAIEAYMQKAEAVALDVYETLTTREREIFHLLAEGSTNPQIAAQLSISPRTVEVHRARIMQKLGLATQTDLIRFALQRGILPME